MKYFGNKNFTVDTINNNFICCQQFKAKESDLEGKPLILNNEINMLDFKNSTIYISKSDMDKLIKSVNRYQQFSICINGKPKINGYFIGLFSKYYSENYSLHYSHSSPKAVLKNKSYQLFIDYGKKGRPIDSINEKDLFNAAKNTNRLLKTNP